MSFSTFWFLAVASIIAASYGSQIFARYVSRQRLIVAKGCQPAPSLPQRDPIFGLDVILRAFRSLDGGRRNLTLKEQLDEYGSTFTTRLYGSTRFFSIEPRNLQAVFAYSSPLLSVGRNDASSGGCDNSNGSCWGVEPLRRFVFEPLIGHGIMNSDGRVWEASRALLKPMFSRSQLLTVDALERHVARLIALLPRDGSTVDMQCLFARQALDVSTEFLFGTSTETLSEKPDIDAQPFLDAYNYALLGVGKRMHLPFFNLFTQDRKFWESCRTAKGLVDRCIDRVWERQKQTDKTNTLLEKPDRRIVLAAELLRQTQDKSAVRDQLLNIFLPAHDANAIALTNVFFAMARHPHMYEKLRAEVVTVVPTPADIISIDKLKGLTYLQAVIRETMRLYPSIGTTSRIALRDTILPMGGGKDGSFPVLVRKGDMFSTSFYALHRRKDIWGKDADEFRPERWDELAPPTEGGGNGNRQWAFLPFLAGPRVCPGQTFAWAEISYTIVRILQTFERIENRDPTLEFIERYKITTESKNGAKIALHVKA